MLQLDGIYQSSCACSAADALLSASLGYSACTCLFPSSGCSTCRDQACAQPQLLLRAAHDTSFAFTLCRPVPNPNFSWWHTTNPLVQTAPLFTLLADAISLDAPVLVLVPNLLHYLMNVGAGWCSCSLCVCLCVCACHLALKLALCVCVKPST